MKTLTSFAALAAVCALFTATAQAQCESTIFQGGNGLSAAGSTVYFDVTVTAGAPIDITSIEINTTSAVGTPVSYEIWTSSTTYVGNQTNPALWTMITIDDGTATSMGANVPTPVALLSSVTLPVGLTGMAIVARAGGHSYTNGNGANQQYVGALMTLDLGSSSAAPFTGNLFDPRVFNGSLCTGGTTGGTGTPFCDPNENNSTGMPTNMTAAFGSGVGSDLHLEATQGPSGQFGYFLIGTDFTEPGIMLPNSSGRLCLALAGGNSIGRYNVGGSTFNSLGQFDAAGILQNNVGTSTVGTGFDVPATVPITGSPMIMAGETWNFQLWHREAGGDSNFSNGLSVAF